jgi:transcription elongation factor Elf1
VKDGIGKRKRCFDISSPFYLNVPKYKCQSHGKFNLLKCTSQNSFTFPSLVKFKKNHCYKVILAVCVQSSTWPLLQLQQAVDHCSSHVDIKL